MSWFNTCRLLAVLTIACFGWSELADARPARVDQIPNGRKFSCASCHVDSSGGGARNAFGDEIEKNYLTPRGASGRVDWNAALAMLDSDGDGVSNGQELGDPDGDLTIDPNITTVTNPGDASDFAQMPGDKAPRATSVMIGSMTIREDVKNPRVPTGEQTLTITFDAPLVVSESGSSSGSDPDSTVAMPNQESGGIELVNVLVIAYPIELMTTASNWAVSDDKMTFTATLDLPENATYQMIISGADTALEILHERQEYYFGTVELSDAVVSGRAMLPSGFTLNDEPPGLAVLMDSEAYSNLLATLDDNDDQSLGQFLGQLIEQGLSTIVRISHFDILESSPEQLAFELKHVPDGSYILNLSQSAVDAEGELVELSAFVGIDAMGAIDSNALIRVANGASATGLQVALQSEIEIEATSIQRVRVARIDAENNRFFVQRDGREVAVSVTVATQGDTSSFGTVFVMRTGISHELNEIWSQLEQGMIPGTELFSFDQLMAGNTVSILGLPGSDGAIRALFVLRHVASALIGDLNGDNAVNFSDFLLFAQAFGKRVGDEGYNPKADLNNDNAVNFADFLLFAANFGN